MIFMTLELYMKLDACSSVTALHIGRLCLK